MSARDRLSTILSMAAGLAVPSTASADPTVFGVSPLPNREADPSRLFLADSVPGLARGRIGDERIDVVLSRQLVELDVHPTVVSVHVEMELEVGERGAPGVAVGFPEELPLSPGLTVDELEVAVNGHPVEAQFVGRWANAFDLSMREVGGPEAEKLHQERRRSWGRSLWWHWRMDFERDSTVTLDLRYLLATTNPTEANEAGRFGQELVFVLRTAGMWRGPVGDLQVRLRLHDIDPATLTVRSESGIRSQDGDALIWQLTNTEPPRDLTIGYEVDSGALTGPASTLSEDASPDLESADAAVRMALGAHDPATWRSYVGGLLADSQSEDPPTRVRAEGRLRDLRSSLTALSGAVDPTQLHAELAGENEVERGAAVGRATEWLGGPPPLRGDACANPDPDQGGYGPPIGPECRFGPFERASHPHKLANLSALVVAAQPSRGLSSRTLAVAAGVILAALAAFVGLRRRRRT